jgi:hypothetical protein
MGFVLLYLLLQLAAELAMRLYKACVDENGEC